jgi:virginiamycin B lyase
MTRILIVGLTCLAASAGASGGSVVASSYGAARPAAPRILGPRRTTDSTPTFRFVSHEVGLRSREIRFLCAIDRSRLHRCPNRYTPPTLRLGQHTLRVRAVDPRGRASRASVARVSVVRPIPHADQTIRVGTAPYNVAAGFGSVWVTVFGELVRLDPATGAVVARISVGGRPWGVAVGEGAVWVGNWFDGSVARVDPATNTVAWRVSLNTPLGEASPVGVAAGGGAVWAADNSSDEVWRLDPATGAILGVAHVGDAHEFVGLGEGGVWVSSEDGTVGELDPASGTVTRSIAAGADADFLAFSPASVWVTNYRAEFLWRIDPATGAVAAKLNIGGGGAQGVAFDGSSLWVAMYNLGEVLCINPTNGRVQRRIPVGKKPRGLAITAGSVWVANSTSGTVSRVRVP